MYKELYRKWHEHPFHPLAHWSIFMAVSLFCTFSIVNTINSTYSGVSEVSAQVSLPTRLIQQADLIHLGSFTLPDTLDTTGQYGFSYVQGTLAFNPANNSLFMVGHVHNQQVAEINIPALGGTATVLQSFRDPVEGRLNQINPSDPNSKQIAGMWVVGDKLIIAGISYYRSEERRV